MPPKSSRGRRVGILGVPKRPGTQVMLFGRYAEPLPSDDDSEDDPDFELPADEQFNELNQTNIGDGERNRKEEPDTSKQHACEANTPIEEGSNASHHTKSENIYHEHEQTVIGEQGALIPNKKTKIGHYKDGQTTAHTCLWSDILPAELLVKIFQYAIHCFGAVPFLCRVSRVCQRWKSIAYEPQFWKQVDLSNSSTLRLHRFSNSVITMLCQKRLSAVEQLNLDNLSELTDRNIETIAKHCPCLQTIGLWGCVSITSKAVSALITSCHKLISLDVSLTKVNTDCIRHLVRELGHQMEALYLRNCKHIIGSQIIPVIQAACHDLRVLDVTGTTVKQLNVEKLQAGCPRLRELFLGNLWLLSASKLKRADTETCKGFLDLEKLSLSCGAHAALSITDNLVHRFLGNSAKLRVLDLRGCKRLGAPQLKKLPAASLEELFLSQTNACYTTVATIVEKWSHSLQVLDLSSNIAIGDDSLQLIANFTLPNMTSLDLSATSLTGDGVRNVLDGCPKLRQLNLSSCVECLEV